MNELLLSQPFQLNLTLILGPSVACDLSAPSIEHCSIGLEDQHWNIEQDTVLTDVNIKCSFITGAPGCLHVKPGINLVIKDSYIHCTELQRGIFLAANANLSLTNVGIYNCGGRFYHGGALRARKANTIEMECVLFQNNAAIDGGGIYVENNSTLSLKDTILYSNSAVSAYGGAIYIMKSTAKIATSEIAKNNASSTGGGIFALASDISISDSVITLNSAGLWGGAGAFGGSFLSIFDSVINNNYANDTGGAMTLRKSNLTLSNVSMKDNIAGQKTKENKFYCTHDQKLVSNIIIVDNYLRKDLDDIFKPDNICQVAPKTS